MRNSYEERYSDGRRHVGERWQDERQASGEVKGREERRARWGWRVGKEEGMGGGCARPRLGHTGTSSAGGGEGWHGEECFREVTVRRRRRRREAHEDRTEKERGVWRDKGEAPRDGRACTDG